MYLTSTSSCFDNSFENKLIFCPKYLGFDQVLLQLLKLWDLKIKVMKKQKIIEMNLVGNFLN